MFLCNSFSFNFHYQLELLVCPKQGTSQKRQEFWGQNPYLRKKYSNPFHPQNFVFQINFFYIKTFLATPLVPKNKNNYLVQCKKQFRVFKDPNLILIKLFSHIDFYNSDSLRRFLC